MKLLLVLAAVTLGQAGQLDRVYLPSNARSSAGSNFLQTPHHSSNGVNAYSNTLVSNDYVQSGQINNAYLPPNAIASTGSNFVQTPQYSSNGFNDQNINAYSSNNYAQNAYSGFEARPERAQAARERNAAILRQDNYNDGETYSYAYETENGIYAEENGVATNGVQAQGGYSYTGDDGQVYSVRYTADENGFVPQGDHLPTPPPIPEAILKSLEKIALAQAARAGYNNEGSYTEDAYSGNGQQQYYNTDALNNYNSNSATVDNTYLQPQRNIASIGNTYLPPHRNSASVGNTYLPPYTHRNQY